MVISLLSPASAARTRSGVNGVCGTRTPMALKTALPTAACVEIVGGSPMPMTPRSGMSSMWTTIFGMSCDAAELVELHVGVDLPAGLAVHDALLEQGVVDAHDDAAGHLRFAGQHIDDQAAVLHGHDLRAADHAGLGIDRDLGDLHAADAAVGHVRSLSGLLATRRPSTCRRPWPGPCRAWRRLPSTV